ncbi:MAG: hemin uptake protein HemP [Planctomycetaceae bacterium]|nr:hemin uptake protein HemP [Planctomycetaceae bacterium]
MSGIVPRTLDSAELLHGDKEVLIRHGSETYRLRLTRQGKLILQK